MNPKLDRPDPPYLQLVSYYREQIKSGALKDGQRLPAVREVAEEWDLAFTTAAKALRQLAAEGLVTTSNKGTFVFWGESNTYTPRERLAAMRRSGRIYPASERAAIISAAVVDAPADIAEKMLIEPGVPVIRRERVTLHGDTPVTYSVSWMPGELAEQVPALVATDRIPGGTVGAVEAATGRRVSRDTYRECARRATAKEASHLGVSEGDPVLCGENVWYDRNGAVLEFGGYIIPQGRWVTVAD